MLKMPLSYFCLIGTAPGLFVEKKAVYIPAGASTDRPTEAEAEKGTSGGLFGKWANEAGALTKEATNAAKKVVKEVVKDDAAVCDPNAKTPPACCAGNKCGGIRTYKVPVCQFKIVIDNDLSKGPRDKPTGKCTAAGPADMSSYNQFWATKTLMSTNPQTIDNAVDAMCFDLISGPLSSFGAPPHFPGAETHNYYGSGAESGVAIDDHRMMPTGMMQVGPVNGAANTATGNLAVSLCKGVSKQCLNGNLDNEIGCRKAAHKCAESSSVPQLEPFVPHPDADTLPEGRVSRFNQCMLEKFVEASQCEKMADGGACTVDGQEGKCVPKLQLNEDILDTVLQNNGLVYGDKVCNNCFAPGSCGQGIYHSPSERNGAALAGGGDPNVTEPSEPGLDAAGVHQPGPADGSAGGVLTTESAPKGTQADVLAKDFPVGSDETIFKRDTIHPHRV